MHSSSDSAAEAWKTRRQKRFMASIVTNAPPSAAMDAQWESPQ
jgi:hypothetical protein